MGSPNFGMGPNYGSAFGGLPQQPWQTWQQPQYQYQQFTPFQSNQYWQPQQQQNTGTTGALSNMGGGKGGGYGAGSQSASGNSGTLGNGLFSQNSVTGPNFKSAGTQTQPQNSGSWWSLSPTADQMNWAQNQWSGFGNTNSIQDFLNKWNSFSTPDQAFQWAGQQDMGGGGYKNAMLMADQLSGMTPGRNSLWSQYINWGQGTGQPLPT